MRILEGRIFASDELSNRGERVRGSCALGGTRAYGTHTEELAMKTSVGSGRTIALKRKYAFCRVEVEVSAEHESDKSGDAFDALSAVVDEMLARETSKFGDGDREAVPVVIPEWADNVTVYVSYGLTIPQRGMNSLKVDVGIRQPISSPSEAEAVISELQSTAAARVKARRAAVESGESGGIGL